MKSAVSGYAFINAKLRARISTLIPRELMIQMAQARSLEETVRSLGGTRYKSAAHIYETSGDLLLTELEITRIHYASFSEIYHHAVQFSDRVVAAFVATLLMRYEIGTIKNALRLWFERVKRQRSVEDKLPYLLRSVPPQGDPQLLEKVVNADEENLQTIFKDRPYGRIVSESLPKVIERESLFPLEIALDRWYYADLAAATAELSRRDRLIADRLIGIEIDVINVNWIVRIKDLRGSATEVELIPDGTLTDARMLSAAMSASRPAEYLADYLGKRIGNGITTREDDRDHGGEMRMLAFIETLLNQLLQYESRRALGGYPFTIGVVLAYVALVQQEANGLVTVLNGKYYDLSPSRVEALL